MAGREVDIQGPPDFDSSLSTDPEHLHHRHHHLVHNLDQVVAVCMHHYHQCYPCQDSTSDDQGRQSFVVADGCLLLETVAFAVAAAVVDVVVVAAGCSLEVDVVLHD